MARPARIALAVVALLFAGAVGFFLGVVWHVGIVADEQRKLMNDLDAKYGSP